MTLAVQSMRTAIAKYTVKNHQRPHSLQDLVRDGELRALPVDPVTHSSATWRMTMQESVSVDDFTSTSPVAPPELIDVHSGATGHDSHGRAWADY